MFKIIFHRITNILLNHQGTKCFGTPRKVYGDLNKSFKGY